MLLVISLGVEFILALYCLLFHFFNIRKKALTSHVSYQTAWLLVALFVSWLRVGCLLVTTIFYNLGEMPGFFVNPNWRLFLIFLAFAELNYFISYFTRFRYIQAVRSIDKFGALATQFLLYFIPFIFIFTLSFPTSPSVPVNFASLSFAYQFPENLMTDHFLEVIFLVYFLILLSQILVIWTKGKVIRALYLLLLGIIVCKFGYAHWEVVLSFHPVLVNILHVLIRLLLDSFYVLFIIVGKEVLSQDDKLIV